MDTAVHSSSDVTTLYEGDRNIGIDPIVIPAVGRGEIYVLGIVDILQQFTCRKKTECCLKQFGAVLRGGHPQCMSIIPAADYANRLRNYIDKNIE